MSKRKKVVFVGEIPCLTRWKISFFLGNWLISRQKEEDIHGLIIELVQQIFLPNRIVFWFIVLWWQGKKNLWANILPKIASDHKSIMLHIEEEEDLCPIPFQFNPLWKDQDGFMNVVSKEWELPVVGSSNFVWERKLKNTKVALNSWAKLSQKNPFSERKEALATLEKIQL